MIIGVFRQLNWFYCIRCYITLSFLIYPAGCYLFRELCQPWHSVHHSMPPVRKCRNVTDSNELPDLCLLNSPDQHIFHYKIWGNESLAEKAKMWTIWSGIWLMSEFEWDRVLLTVALISGVDVCMPAFEPEEVFEYSPWHKLAKTLLTVIN